MVTTKDLDRIGAKYGSEVSELARASSTTEETYYPAIRDLLTGLLEAKSLPYCVRIATSEERSRGGTDRPDLAIYGGSGTFLTVAGEVKLASVPLKDLAQSTERNDQIGRYLLQTGAVLLSNVRSFGLLAPQASTGGRTPAVGRELLEEVELWETARSLADGGPIPKAKLAALADLLERAVSEFAPIAEPEVLARVLALQARRAKADLPARFDAVQGLLEDYGVALGLTFEGEEGLEFFRSSLIQTAFYALFAGWTLWHREGDGSDFDWERLDRYLKIPFLGKLFYEFRHPDRLEELNLAPHLDRAAATLGRVRREDFFARFQAPSLRQELEHSQEVSTDLAAAAITYFYEPFLESFDPELRKALGVWYTPREIVRYQVRKIDRLLREDLGCSRGLADDRVVVLDPCCGTGAYLIEVTRCIAQQLKHEGEDSLLPAKILDALCHRILGFEILTAPFVIAQLQLYLLLADLGAAPNTEDRPAVYLTNALTGWGGPEQIKLNFPELRREHEAARRVKRGARIIVILGNPPYNRFAGAAIAEEADLVDHYKGIRRDAKGRQIGQSALYARYGVRKQLLDDLYIRFIRLAEQRIGEHAEFGVVSFISNSSYLTGRSHPLMRESVLRSFDDIWVDNLNGDKYRTGKVIPQGIPGEGTADQSVFTTNQDPRGIQVGTCIATYLKRNPKKGRGNTIHYRDFWGRSATKRKALLEPLVMDKLRRTTKRSAAAQPEGPPAYEEIVPTAANRWMFSPRDVQAGFEAWPALDELFPVAFQGVNPNRGLDGSLIDTDREALVKRMKLYYEANKFQEVREAMPVICEARAGYEPEAVWAVLRKTTGYDEGRIKPYLIFPFDLRWIYYETEAKLLNRARPDFGEHLEGNEFLVTVPQPRRITESRPLFTTTLADLHLHDRGSVCFPRIIRLGKGHGEPLFASRERTTEANLDPIVWGSLRRIWSLKGGVAEREAEKVVAGLFRLALAIVHSPMYERDHADGIAQDFAHLPIPKSRDQFDELSKAGDRIATLLDPLAQAESVIRETLGNELRTIAVSAKVEAGRIRADDLKVTVSYYGGAQGRWLQRPYHDDEAPISFAPDATGDLFINDAVCFSNVPEPVWRYELGGYPVLKKWLGYRQATRRDGRALTLAEAGHFRGMVQRISALLVLHPELDRLYEQAAADAFSAEELGLRI